MKTFIAILMVWRLPNVLISRQLRLWACSNAVKILSKLLFATTLAISLRQATTFYYYKVRLFFSVLPGHIKSGASLRKKMGVFLYPLECSFLPWHTAAFILTNFIFVMFNMTDLFNHSQAEQFKIPCSSPWQPPAFGSRFDFRFRLSSFCTRRNRSFGTMAFCSPG